MNSKPFKGSNVFMSRNLVPPELFDSLHDALKLNGAEVFLCCDPSRSGPSDYHVISSSDHEKYEDLRAKGCNLVGPQCVLSCAKERRPLPKQGFTCCLAMDGVKVIASGFETEERGKIEKMVLAMGGSLENRTSSEVSFIIVKNVTAAKYKWAVHVKKPTVTINWLHQCWNEHRIVPQESYRVPTFSGLIICVTRIPPDDRKEMEKVITQNGGRYSADLTKKCTHLICDAPEGDKYRVAQRWGNIHIVTRKWFDQSISRRACLPEEAYSVHAGSLSSMTARKGCLIAKQSQEKSVGNSQSFLQSMAPESISCSVIVDSDLEATLSQKHSANEEECKEKHSGNEEECKEPPVPPITDMKLDGCVADDSQSEDDDLYLSDSKICLVGFDSSDMRRLVNLIRKGGGTRDMSCDERLTHIVVGAPSDVEKKELRGLAALGVIHVVRPTWLEDCNCAKKEVHVMKRHLAHDLLFPKDLLGSSSQGSTMSKGGGMKQEKVFNVPSSNFPNLSSELDCSKSSISLQKRREIPVDINTRDVLSLGESQRSSQQILPPSLTLKSKCKLNNKQRPAFQNIPSDKPSGIFTGKLFSFSHSFPGDKRDEVVQWINQGGGGVVDDLLKQNADFIVECHGVTPQSSSSCRATYVSSHWVRSCLQDQSLLDGASHILYSPLPCRIPLPGFEHFRFCVSQYDEKARLLLRNLCFILGAKFGEKLTRKVTHLLCKFASGPKFDGACKWGIETVTSEWIYECVRKNEVVALDMFRPREASHQDREAGLCTVSQYPTQAAQMISDDSSTQLSCQTLDLRKPLTENAETTNRAKDEAKYLNHSIKRARLVKYDSSTNSESDNSIRFASEENNRLQHNQETSQVVPDVAAAIEDLLEQTSKIHDLREPGESECSKTIFTSDYSVLSTADHAASPTAFGLSKHWLSRVEKMDEPHNTSADATPGVHYGFSETQTESQLVGYEEDLSGRQMIIERVRTRSSMI